jgi:hypothetical protein
MLKEEVLFANDAFYLAFAAGDLPAMDRLWADRPDVVCLHPGWPALTDRDAVMASWARILGNPRQPPVSVQPVRTVEIGEAMLVVCYERMEDTVLVAGNLFEAGDRGPRLVMHQSGLCADPPDLPPPDRADVQ